MLSMDERPIIVGISGASGAIYGLHLLEALRRLEIPAYLVMTTAARMTLAVETGLLPAEVERLATRAFAPDDFAAPIASGSFPTRGMIVAPCSIKSLSAIAHSFADNLLVRAADVTLKEGRPLLLMVRETPLHLGHLRLMVRAAEMGAILFPPVPALYQHPSSLEAMVDATVGRMLARLGIENDLYRPWGMES